MTIVVSMKVTSGVPNKMAKRVCNEVWNTIAKDALNKGALLGHKYTQ